MEIQRLASLLNGHITTKVISTTVLREPLSINFPELEGSIPENAELLLCEAEQLQQLLAQGSIRRGMTVLLAGSGPKDAVEAALKREFNLFVTDYTFLELYQKVSTFLQAVQQFQLELYRQASMSHSPRMLAEAMSRLLGLPILMLGADGSVLYIYGYEFLDDSCMDEVRLKNTLSPAKLSGFFKGHFDYAARTELLSRTKDGNLCYSFSVNHTGQYTTYLLAFFSEQDNDSLLLQKLSCCAECLRDFSRSNKTDNSAEVFQEVLSEILSTEKVLLENVNFKLGKLIYPLGLYYNFGVIGFAETSRTAIPFAVLIESLRKIFPRQNIARYNDYIVILLSSDIRIFTPDIDYDALEQLMRFYDSYIVFSSFSKNRSRIPALFSMLMDALAVAKVLGREQNKRIFLRSELAMESTIHFCQRSHALEKSLGGDTLFLRAHPGVTTLAMYDTHNGEQLVELLHTYLTAHNNVSRTAQLAHMHRNTVISKLKVIREIVVEDIDDGELLLYLLFSCEIIRYCKDFSEKSDGGNLMPFSRKASFLDNYYDPYKRPDGCK